MAGTSEVQTEQDWVQRVRSIGRFTDGDRRAPYKPLLLLWIIGRQANGLSDRVSFEEAESPLKELLGNHRFKQSPPKPQDPFVYLGTDRELWRVETASGEDVTKMDQQTKSRVTFLRSQGVIGGLGPDFAKALEDPHIRSVVVNELLAMEFPETIHEQILEEVDLGHLVAPVPSRRDPQFKRVVLLAYENRCAFCGFDGSLRNSPVAIDAAHVKMRSHPGPDHITNGVALCTFHHRLFDRGALGLDPDRRILVSQHMIVRAREANGALMRLIGMPMLPPQRGYDPPAIPHVNWHYWNLFVRPARRPSPPSTIRSDGRALADT